ncbi:MAG: DnaB-like helicase terminal domain, partial [Candidatus Dependentiae bacterium]|nr:DnaB-like helicase terminal domain [Candidatus Dependentiae bacterium]
MNFDNNELAALSPELALGSRDTEAAVLSVLITFPAVFDDVSDRIKPAFFSDELYRAIF